MNCTMNATTPVTSTFSNTKVMGEMTILDFFLYSFGFLFGVPTHSYVLWLIVTGTGSGVASEFFILNLSVCEIGTCLSIFVYVLDYLFSSFRTLRYFMLGLGITGRPLFQCLICVERYLAVVHPVTFLKYKPLRYRVICCTAAWIMSLGSCLCCMFTIVSCHFYIYVCFYTIQFLFFLSIQLFCLVAVLRALKQSGPGERGRKREEENHMKRSAFNVILINTASMIIIYMPFAISGLSYILTHQYFQEAFSFGLVCFQLAGFVQPFLYLNRVGKLSFLNKILNCSVFRS